MIGTHAPKMLNSRLKQAAVRARLPASVPKHLICSANVRMRREMWALPLNAADMKAVREDLALSRMPMGDSIPPITDGAVKQVLLPVGPVGSDEYVCAAPVSSCGLMHELWHRVREKNLPSVRWIVQPSPAAMANHGEQLLLQGGALRLLRRGVRQFTRRRSISFPVDVVQLSGRVEHMNLGSGMVATGFPAMTAIGGLVHALERECDEELDFAVGYRSIQFSRSAKKSVEFRRGSIPASKAGLPGFVADELTGSGRFFLLLRPASLGADIQRVADAACTVRRVAGGVLFDDAVDVLAPGAEPGDAMWIADVGHRVMVHRELAAERPIDVLDAALNMYGHGGQWRDGRWLQPMTPFTLNMTGYGYLGAPQAAEWTRAGYPGCWAEPLFSVVSQTRWPAWWRRQVRDWGVNWCSASNPLSLC